MELTKILVIRCGDCKPLIRTSYVTAIHYMLNTMDLHLIETCIHDLPIKFSVFLFSVFCGDVLLCTLSNVLLFYYIEYVISCFIMFILIVLYVCLMLAVQSSSKCIIPKILKFSSMTYIIYSSCSKCLGISGLAESSILRFLGQSFYDSICFPEQQNLLYCVVVSRPR